MQFMEEHFINFKTEYSFVISGDNTQNNKELLLEFYL